MGGELLDWGIKGLLGIAVSWMTWEKQQEKKKRVRDDERLTRLEERHRALDRDVQDIKAGIKDINRKVDDLPLKLIEGIRRG